jgi:hypothetical protein
MPVRACLAGEKLPRLQADGFLVRGQVCLAHPDVLNTTRWHGQPGHAQNAPAMARGKFPLATRHLPDNCSRYFHEPPGKNDDLACQ